MRHLAITSLLISISTFVVAACSEPGGPPDGDEDPITVEHAGTAGLALESTAVTGRGYFELGHDLIDAGCVTYGGVPDDPDGDDIPTLITLTLNCTLPRDGAASELVTGTITLSDPSPMTAEFRFLATYALNSTVSDGNGQISNGTLDTQVDALLVGQDFSLDVSGSETGLAIGSATQLNYTKTHNWSIDYAPSGAWNPGLPLADGAFALTGDWELDVDGQLMAQATLTTNASLSGASGCGPGSFDAGNLEATWNGHDVVLTWTGCGDPTLTVDGEVKPLFDSILPFFSFD